jgi:hypothetical protein
LNKIVDVNPPHAVRSVIPRRRAAPVNRAGGRLRAKVRGIACARGRGRARTAAQRGAAGNILFEKVGVLQPDKLDRKAFLDVANHAAGRLAEGDEGADLRALLAPDRGARLRDVDDAAGQIDAVGQDEPRHRVARGDAAVAAIFRQSQNATVGEPGELGGELVALARRGRDRHGEAVLELPRDDPFQPPDVIHIGDDAFARLAGDRRDQSHAAGRHIDDLTGKLAPIRQHVAPEQVDLHALEPPALLAQRQDHVLLLG